MYHSFHKDRLLRELKRTRWKSLADIHLFFKGNKKLAAMVIAQLEQTQPKLIIGDFIHGYDITKEGSVFIQTGSFVGRDLRKYGSWFLGTALAFIGVYFTIKSYYATVASQEKSQPPKQEETKPQIERKDSLKSQISLPIKDTHHKNLDTSCAN